MWHSIWRDGMAIGTGSGRLVLILRCRHDLEHVSMCTWAHVGSWLRRNHEIYDHISVLRILFDLPLLKIYVVVSKRLLSRLPPSASILNITSIRITFLDTTRKPTVLCTSFQPHQPIAMPVAQPHLLRPVPQAPHSLGKTTPTTPTNASPTSFLTAQRAAFVHPYITAA